MAKHNESGQQAEDAVAEELKNQGHEVIAQNWKTKVCEIDIVTTKDKVVYFTEVKYRSTFSQGGGFDYVTPKKLGQMEFAARVWCQQNNWNGDYRLQAAAMSGDGELEIIEL